MPRGYKNGIKLGFQKGHHFNDGKHRSFATEFKKGMVSLNKGKHLSEETRSKISIARSGKKYSNISGEKNGMWKGGRYKQSKNKPYILIYKPDHPYQNKKNYVFEHRLVMEKFLGRYLTRKEVIHHLNGILNDNRIENLQLFDSQYFHMLYHKEFNKNHTPNGSETKSKISC